MVKLLGRVVLIIDVDECHAGDYRDLAPWTQALTVVSWLCLFLHAVRAGLTNFATANTGQFERASSLELPVEVALKCLFVASAGVGLAWLYRASLNAHTLSPGMKYSPRAVVVWFFVPALNFLYSISVVYEIWARSGGPERAKILIIWWAFTILTIYGGPIWLLGFTAPLPVQVAFAGSTLSFLVLARRVDGFQRRAAAVAQFGDTPAPGYVVPEHPAFRPPPTNVETVDPPRFDAPGNSTLHIATKTPTLRGPGVILIRRPVSPKLDPPTDV